MVGRPCTARLLIPVLLALAAAAAGQEDAARKMTATVTADGAAVLADAGRPVLR